MADNSKPRINITRGTRSRPESESGASESTRSSSGSSWGWELADWMADGVRDVWLAGLGAVSVVEEQGTRLFESLVEEGKTWEQERREEAGRAYKEMEDRVKAQTGTRAEADAAPEGQIAEYIRDGVDDALERAGVPSQRAVDELRDQVDALVEKTDRLMEALEKRADCDGEEVT